MGDAVYFGPCATCGEVHGGWQKCTPEQHAVSTAKLRAAVEHLRANGCRGPIAFEVSEPDVAALDRRALADLGATVTPHADRIAGTVAVHITATPAPDATEARP